MFIYVIGGSRGGVTGVATPSLSNLKKKESNKTKQKIEATLVEKEEEKKREIVACLSV